MRLLHATVRQVRLHQQLELQFDPRFTLLGGPNEAGKSTVVEALHKVLFLKATATGKAVDEMRSRLHSGLPEVELGFEAAGRRWELRKRFSGASGTCQLSSDAGLALRGAAAEEQLARLLGVDGPIEGRRHSQLPLRWAHLWVRQGEAGTNLLGSPSEAYDVEQLVQQLQQRGGAAAALESPIDRLVSDQLQARLDQQFTATGKVKAGSPLAAARQRCLDALLELEQAQALHAELEAAMEKLRQISERLQLIERHERPELQRALQLEAQVRLRRAQVEPLRQQLSNLEQAQAQLESVQRQLSELGAQQQAWQLQRTSRQEQYRSLEDSCQSSNQACQELNQQQQQQVQRLDLAQQLLDLANLEQEALQLEEHQQQFQRLQIQAENCKQSLALLVPIDGEAVRALRQAEQQWAQAEARSHAIATTVNLIEADQAVNLAGQPLSPGATVQLSGSAEVTVGGGVRLRISPGGGEATVQAAAALQQCGAALHELQKSIGVADSEAAEVIAQQRMALELELANLRKAASAIPWSRLEKQIAELDPKRQRLLSRLEQHQLQRQSLAERGELPQGREQLEVWIEQLRRESNELRQKQQQAEAELTSWRQKLEEQRRTSKELDRNLEQLTGSLNTLAERQLALQASHGDRQQLTEALNSSRQVLLIQEAELSALDSELIKKLPEGGAIEQRLRLLDGEKDTLLTSRGQNEQRCLTLSSNDPAALMEHRQAGLESAQADMEALELQTKALQMLQSLFHQARQDFSQRYSKPLEQAIRPYLQYLQNGRHQASLDFDPKNGFGNLELQQGQHRFGFEQLSGGMREQLAAALRLALAEVLQPVYDNCLPLIFDDAFTNSDQQRLQALQQMLRRGANHGMQLILLSCNPNDYQALAAELGSEIALASP
ncbi:MAG: AAA family ATPase [Cyanobacteria bacterium]|nr:AAA family ATPase [Cyanobacteriota bacterium]